MAGGRQGKTINALHLLMHELGDSFDGLLTLSKEQMQPLLENPGDYLVTREAQPGDLVIYRHFGMLGTFLDGFFVVFMPDVDDNTTEVQCYHAAGIGGYGGHTYVLENGVWRDLEE